MTGEHTLRHWLEHPRGEVLGASGARTAIDFTLKRWEALARYLDAGRHPIYSNPIEIAIRTIALSLNNWLFAGYETARACEPPRS